MSSSKKRRHDNYVVLQGYMVEEMGLTGKELIAYAVVYGFAQAGSPCEVSMRYFQFWLGCTRATAQNTIKSLENKGFIERRTRFINGVQFNSFILGPNAVTLKPGSPEVYEAAEAERKPQENTPHIFYTGGSNSKYPEIVENDIARSEGRIEIMQGASISTRASNSSKPYIVKTDTDMDNPEGFKEIQDLESESDNTSRGAILADDGIADDFGALRSHVPSTDGYSFGLENYRKLRELGYSAIEVSDAADALTEQLRKDYPDRAAKFFPHAERILDPRNPGGVMRFLQSKSRNSAQSAESLSSRELYHFALTSTSGRLTREASQINEALARASNDEERTRLMEMRTKWTEDHRAEIAAAWTEKQRYRRRR